MRHRFASRNIALEASASARALISGGLPLSSHNGFRPQVAVCNSGCCDHSPGQHATGHARSTEHTVIRSFEPGEDWFWDYVTEEAFEGPELAPPEHHPLNQPVPGPAGRVPRNWQRQLHD